MSNKFETNKERLEGAIDKFVQWLENYGETSYDRMDFLSSKFGMFTKKMFYKNKCIGTPFALFSLLQETFIPSALKLYGKPRREAIADAHYARGFMNLYQVTGKKEYLEKAEHFLEVLKKSSIKNYSGYCWGYTFSWVNNDGSWPENTPCITVTPYPFWAFLQHYELTKSQESKNICLSIAEFAVKDLKKITTPDGVICTSYSTVDNRFIVNANTYRAALLLDAYKISRKEIYKEEAEININFVLHYQYENGKWYYEAVGERDKFIDNFHTAFVLRNLLKCYNITGEKKIMNAIQKGYSYYRNKLFRPDNTPIHFSEIKNNKLRKYEMYDYAEGITLGCLLGNKINNALNFSKKLANQLINEFQLKDGHFITRVTSFGMKHKVPYHRWPQAQLFHSLTLLLKTLTT